MWIEAAVLVGTGIILSNLVVRALARLGIRIGFCSTLKQAGYCNREEKDNGFDGLPDDILCIIVSRLIPKEASQTSILSRRWRYIWTMSDSLRFVCLGSLDIRKWSHDRVASWEKKRFLKAINQSLQLYSSLDRKLKVFLMHCCFLEDYHTSHLLQWVQTLARLDVQELYLGSSCLSWNGYLLDGRFTFPFKLIDGLSELRYINLSFCYLETSFLGQYNSLIGLDFTCMPLLGDEVSDVLMSCPNLKFLHLERCGLPVNLRIFGPNLKLKELVLRACYYVQHLVIDSLFNALHIWIDIDNYVEISLSSVPKLEVLHLRSPGMNHGFGDVRSDLPLLDCLLVETSLHKIVQLPPTFHVFGNISTLFLLSRRDSSYPEASEDMDLWPFAGVLGACPRLENFHLEVGGRFCKQKHKQNHAPWPVLEHQHLRFMELSGFSDTQNELDFLKFVLTSAAVLETLHLRSSSSLRFDGRSFSHEHVKDSKTIDAVAVCEDLLMHAVSPCAEVWVF